MPARVASVWLPGRSGEGRAEGDGGALTAALLEASPRVMRASAELWRVDAGGWSRRGGERALAEALRTAAAGVGAPGSRVGVADVPVAADAAARTAREDPVRVVPAGESRAFLAPLLPELLPVSDEVLRTLRSLGIRRIGEVTARPAGEWEARFGPEGLRLHRWARGRDHRGFRPVRPEDRPEAAVEVEGGVEGMEPLLFLLRHLLDRISGELGDRGRCAARLRIRLLLDGRDEEAAEVSPARPTRRTELLMDLCRAALERRFRPGGEGRGADGPFSIPEGDGGRRIRGVALEVVRMDRARARQGNLFARRWRDPLQAAATLSRLRARLGQGGVATPDPRRDHRPESRNRWRAMEATEGAPSVDPVPGGDGEDGVPPVLRLLPEPRPVEVGTDGPAGGGPPREVWDDDGRHEVVAAEGPERLSGDWWEDPYRREYFRVCTAGGELLWVFREYRRDGRLRWWLHGWWD